MFQQPSTHPAGAGAPWLEHAVLGLDRWLRQRQGVYEYSTNPLCIFRIARAQADGDARLSDGIHIKAGAPILDLHLWNEHVPPMSPGGATVPWAREFTYRIDVSMRDLARHLKWTRALDDVVALRGNMRLGTAAQNGQLARLAARYGFEPATGGAGPGPVQRFAENAFIFLLVLAINPVALRAPVLRRDNKLVYLSRAALERRYAAAPTGAGRWVGDVGSC